MIAFHLTYAVCQDCDVHRRVAVLVRSVHVRSAGDQQGNEIGPWNLRCEMQRRPKPLGRTCIHVCTSAEKELDRFDAAATLRYGVPHRGVEDRFALVP